MSTKLWTINDVSDHLGIPVNTLYQWRTKGYGPPGDAWANTSDTDPKTSMTGLPSKEPRSGARLGLRPHEES
jgi:hypothetical protein